MARDVFPTNRWLESNPNYQDIVTDEFWVALGSWGTGEQASIVIQPTWGGQ